MHSTHLSDGVKLLIIRARVLVSRIGYLGSAFILAVIIDEKVAKIRLVFWLDRLWALGWVMGFLIAVLAGHPIQVLV